jgi:DNA topoisomerase-1
MNILHLDSGLFTEQSVSRQLSTRIIKQLQQQYPDASLVYRDLVAQPINHLDAELGPHFFPEGDTARVCQACKDNAELPEGRLGLKLGKFGAFIGCSNYPECKYTKPLVVPDKDGDEDAGADALANEPKILGEDPGTGRTVSLRRGPYGPYVQIDAPPESAEEEKKRMAIYDQDIEDWKEAKKEAKKAGEKIPPKRKIPSPPMPKRQGLPKGLTVDQVTLENALSLLALPREVGVHPETGKMIEAGIGRFGPFVKHNNKFTSIPKDDDVMSIGMNRAVDLIAQKEIKDAEKAARPWWLNAGACPIPPSIPSATLSSASCTCWPMTAGTDNPLTSCSTRPNSPTP